MPDNIPLPPSWEIPAGYDRIMLIACDERSVPRILELLRPVLSPPSSPQIIEVQHSEIKRQPG